MPEDVESRSVPLGDLDEQYARLRLSQPRQVRTMAESLKRYGQISPVVVCRRTGRLAILDGFKRLAAARELGWTCLLVRDLQAGTERAAVAAIYGLNRGGRGLMDLEEALVVQELVRVHGLSQVEVACLLDRHKSWVSRRLGLVERLCETVQDDVRVGLVPVTVAREVARLPRGNQPEVAAAVHRHGLGTREAAVLVSLFERAAGRTEQEALLERPREALQAHAKRETTLPFDPRLGPAAQNVQGKLMWAREDLARLDRLVRSSPAAAWTDAERSVLRPLVLEVASLCEDLGDTCSSAADAMGTSDHV